MTSQYLLKVESQLRSPPSTRDACVVVWLYTMSRAPAQHVLLFQLPPDELRGVTPAIPRIHLQNSVQGQGGQRREEQQAEVWGLLVDKKSLEMHGESKQSVSISVPPREGDHKTVFSPC